ncbi:MAG: sigma-70 family RNA polymerase sigma factor [Clostridia bacterium]|nr:sigma-70 family RNA polymerase sigma factor [Clostridia bacterium]
MRPSGRYLADADIIELFFQRNEDAIYETDRKYRAYLLSVAKSFLSDIQDAEECLNDTYHDVWCKIPPSRPENFKAFLSVILRRTAIDCYKKASSQKRPPAHLLEPFSELEGLLSSTPDQHETVEAHELAAFLSRFLRSLSQEDRFLFLSRYYEGLSVKEIAHSVGSHISTVNKRLQKLREALKHDLEKEGYPI